MAQITRAAVTKLVHQIRDGKPPKLPEGRSEELYWSPVFNDFGVRLLKSGTASWVWQHKTFGRTKRLTIGDVRVLDESEAQETAKRLWAKILLHRVDPQEAKAEAKRTAKVLFESVVDQFLKSKENRRSSTKVGYRLYLKGYYFKPLWKLPIDEVTAEQINLQVEKVIKESGQRTGSQCLVPMKGLFKWAIKNSILIDHNPMAKVNEPEKPPSRKRILTHEEMRTIWVQCEAWEADVLSGRRQRHWTNIPDIPRAVRLLFLTGCRRQEIGDLELSEINRRRNELELPGSRTKNHEDLVLPLVDTALGIILSVKERPGHNHLFGTKPGQGINLNGAHNKINERIRKSGGTVPPHWTVHDIRRTVRSGLGEIGINRDLAERIVNHVNARTEQERTYDRYTYGPQMREALVKWESHLLAIVRGAEQKVVAPPFGRKVEAA
jgi:integrase